MSKSIYLDFEFNQIVEPKVNLVCCATYDERTKTRKKFWLHNSPEGKRSLVKHLKQYDILIGYSCVAEARSILALDKNPLKFRWLDLFLEYRMMTNHNDELQWGQQLVDGKVKYVKKPKPKWERTEEDAATGFKATHSLAECTYKLTGEIRDTKHKTEMRNLIISNPKSFTREQRLAIMDYCLEDVEFLPEIWKKLKTQFRKLAPDDNLQNYFNQALTRGRYSAHTAIMESTGYPIDVKATKNFSRSIPFILMECQRDINEQFPDIMPFKWNKGPSKFSWNQKITREWIADNHDASRWMKTNGGQISLALEAFERTYPFKHSYPRDNFGAQMVRFLKLRQNLYGFSESGGKRKNFWDSVGSDGRVRPYMNIYGAQSSRSQPGASGFMFLKPAWMRALVQPKPGRFIIGMDFGQQEFFLSALETECKNMIEAYLSGDPYLFGAKLAGVIPKDGKREDYKVVRDVFKNTYLGILFGMTKYGLSIKLTNDTGREYDEDDAQEQIDTFEDTFPEYMEWKEELMDAYREGCGIELPCGWRMWSDNDNLRSVCNVPIQGFGASIMRKSVDLAVRRGCSVIFTLHDAIYVEGDVKDFDKTVVALYTAMRDGFQFYYKGTKFFETAGQIKLDPFAWSPDFKKDSEREVNILSLDATIKVPTSNLYIDERAIDEYERFKKYFGELEIDLL